MPSVDILLATYNGTRHLPEQLASFEAQTHGDWRLILRDDGSADGSVALVRDWAVRTGRALLVAEDGAARLGPGASFGRLLARSDAPYFAFSDQDDHWHPDKIARMLAEMANLEARHGAELPLLLHSDLAVVGPELQPTGQRFWQRSMINTFSMGRSEADTDARRGLLLQNVVTGCATLGNAALRRAATPMPEGAYLHDWWVALVAAYLGELRGLPEPLIDYRQHGSNSIGAKSWAAPAVLKRFIAQPAGTVRRTRDVLSRLQRQAGSFDDLFGDRLGPADRAAFQEFATLPTQGLIRRKSFMARHHAHPQSALRRLIMLAMI